MAKDTGNPTTEAVNDAVIGSSDDFFDALENDVNGMVAEDNTEATQQNVDPEQVTQHQNVGSNNVDWDNDGNPYKKRYSDSSKEAVKLRDRYKEVEPFVPVLDAMKNDSGLVEHVRDYLMNGGSAPKNVQEQLGLDKDFEFDANEAMVNPDSDSAKVLNSQVDRVVQARVGQMVKSEQKNAARVQATAERSRMEKEFQGKKGWSDDQFEAFKANAQQHTLTLEDIDLLLNRDQANANVVKSTKNDMLNQMKNVRNIPMSASGANNQGDNRKSAEDSLFDSLVGTDGDLDNLFG